MKHKKKLNNYIKENLKNGYSVEQIKAAFIKYGYDPVFTEKFVKKYELKSFFLRTSIFWLLLLAPALFFLIRL